jgi:peptidoglycan/xylan/chitin deacetylase (PgdA/CDA1 family)
MIKKIYGRLRKMLPKGFNGFITKSLYFLGIKPTVQQIKSPLNKGAVVFSADFEMAWAFRYSKKQAANAEKKGIEERNNVPVFVKLFEEYKIPITWATVGHLFLGECNKENGKVHPYMPRPDYFENKNWLFDKGDWYEHDPCTNFEKDPAWYAPDLIEMIKNSSVNHEFGCHTFSHIDMTYKNCTKEIAQAEIFECQKIARQNGFELKSMVFPGGTLGNYEVLKENGFTNYRKPLNYDVGLPVKDKHGLWAIPSSIGLDKTPYNWSSKTYIKQARSFLKKAAQKRMVVHFWFHPSMNKWYLENVFPEILKLTNSYREKGKIEVLTMQQVAERMEH